MGRAFSTSLYAPPHEPETVRFLQALTGRLPGWRRTLLNDLIKALKAQGAWANQNWYLLCMANQADSLLNLRTPGTDSLVASGNLIFEKYRGFFGLANLGTGVLTGPNMNALTGFTQNDGHVSFWLADEKMQSGTAVSYVGNSVVNNTQIMPKISGNNARFGVNNTTVGDGNLSWGYTDTDLHNKRGWYVAVREGDANNVKGYFNGAAVGAGTAAAISAAPGAQPFKVLQWTYGKVAMASIGASLSAAQITAIHTALQTFMRGWGVEQNFTGEWDYDFTTNPTIVSDEGYVLPVNFSSAVCIYDFENIPRYTFANEVAFDGHRRVYNMLASGTDAPAAGAENVTVVSGRTYVLSFTGTGNVVLSNAATGTLTGQGANARVAKTITAGSTTLTLTVSGDVRFWQLEDVTFQSNKNPAEYVSKGTEVFPYHGAGWDGVKYFATENGNTVSGELVTEATGAALTNARGLWSWWGSNNVCLESDNFEAAPWVAENTPTITANADRCGEVPLHLIGDDSAGSLKGYSQNIVFTYATSAWKGGSIHVKPDTSTSSVFGLWDDTASAWRCFGVLTWSGGLPSVAMTVGVYDGYETLANGTFRLCVRATGVVITNTNQTKIYPATDAALDTSLTGNIYAGGVQWEDNGFATRYIPTTAAAVTRNDCDLRDYNRAGLGWVNANEGTFYADATYIRTRGTYFDAGTGRHAYLFSFHDTSSSGNNRIFINLYPENAPQAIACQCIVGGVQQSSLTYKAWPTGERHRVAFSYKANSLKQSFDGDAVETDAVASIPARLDGILLAGGNGATNVKSGINGMLHKFGYRQSQVSDMELQALSAL